jgi:hypothetical protein
MKYINLNSRKGIINLFADYILQTFNPESDTVIQVTDLNHFLLINGFTTDNSLKDISKVKDSFINEYQELLTKNNIDLGIGIMDIISFETRKMKPISSLWFQYYNSNRPIYHENIIQKIQEIENYLSLDYGDGELIYELIDNKFISRKCLNSPLQISSEFPHGYSLSMGREFLYYGEYISNEIMNSIYSSEIEITLSKDMNNPIQIKSNSIYKEEDIISMILDNFSFDYTTFRKKFNGYNFCDDIKKPTEDKPWLVKEIDSKNLQII